MSSLEVSHFDLEQGSDSTCFSDAEEDGSCYSQFYSTTGGSYDEYSFACVSDPEIIDDVASDSRRVSSVSDCSVEIESGLPEIKVHLDKVERICRICHLDLETNTHESGIPFQLGCSCKDDLGAAHKQCAEAWFKIKGNK
ncbi:uncharacterized protein LOC8273468 isoform X2 [Ricinus communis]|nr:uncharacterized protein LOC8273468 isoform X2 [Ricinus communis]|eukprot:XP_015580066.1 uncharacterized protein LOC8273468 isoform X2 [Ricinus communis]